MGAIAEYQRVGQLDRKSALLTYLAINNDTIFLNLAYLEAVDRPAAFSPFYNLTSLVDTTKMSDSFLDLINSTIPLNVPRWANFCSVRNCAAYDVSCRWTWGSTGFYLDKEAYIEVAKICQRATTKLAAINGGTMVLLPQPISKSMVTESNARGGGPMKVQNREQLCKSPVSNIS